MNQEPDDDRLNVLNALSHRVSSRLSVEQVVYSGREIAASCAAPNLAVQCRYRVTGRAPGVFLRR